MLLDALLDAVVAALMDAVLDALLDAPSVAITVALEGIVGAAAAEGTNTSTKGSAKSWVEVFTSVGVVSRLRSGRVILVISTG